MKGLLRIGAMISVATAMTACTTTRPYNRIDTQARPLIQEVDSILISKQDEIGADIKVSKISSYVQGHIVPVLIDIGLNSYRSGKSNKLVAPIRATMSEYDFAQDLKEEFNQALRDNMLSGSEGLQILREEPQGFRAAYIRHSDADAVMFIDVKYAFTPSFDALNLTSSVMMFPVNPALSPYKEKPDEDDIIELADNIYRNQFLAMIPVGIVGGTTENGAAWAAKSEEELTGLMQKAAVQLAEHIAYDLSIDDVNEEEEPDDEGEIGDEAVAEDLANADPETEEADTGA